MFGFDFGDQNTAGRTSASFSEDQRMALRVFPEFRALSGRGLRNARIRGALTHIWGNARFKYVVGKERCFGQARSGLMGYHLVVCL